MGGRPHTVKARFFRVNQPNDVVSGNHRTARDPDPFIREERFRATFELARLIAITQGAFRRGNVGKRVRIRYERPDARGAWPDVDVAVAAEGLSRGSPGLEGNGTGTKPASIAGRDKL
jgi:hypothetical protein